MKDNLVWLVPFLASPHYQALNRDHVCGWIPKVIYINECVSPRGLQAKCEAECSAQATPQCFVHFVPCITPDLRKYFCVCRKYHIYCTYRSSMLAFHEQIGRMETHERQGIDIYIHSN
jgi:hypothetical protein